MPEQASPRSLGQIAHEAGAKAGGWPRKWQDMGQWQRDHWEALAQAVAAQVKHDIGTLVEDLLLANAEAQTDKTRFTPLTARQELAWLALLEAVKQQDNASS